VRGDRGGAVSRRSQSGLSFMSIETCNAFLEVIGMLNDGCDHCTSYVLDPLPDAESLDDSLARYFSAMSTSRSPPRPAADWHIQTVEISDAWQEQLEPGVRRWFFQERYSPAIADDSQQSILDRFFQHLSGLVGQARVFEVKTRPPMWYECAWNDYAFETPEKRWLLHLGFSD
jgi:hypothetical protein